MSFHRSVSLNTGKLSKKYRIIHQLANPNIFIFGIIHGTRNIGEVLRRRLLRWN